MLRLSLGVLVALVALALSASVGAKGFTRVVLVGTDGEWIEARGTESQIDALLSERGSTTRPRDGYVRLFFVGPGDFPANRARYYPGASCVALDWPSYETTCREVGLAAERLLARARSLTRFRVRPAVLARMSYRGADTFGPPPPIVFAGPVELALDRKGRPARRPTGCFAFAGTWRGLNGDSRPERFWICRDGVHARGLLHPLGRGSWAQLLRTFGPAKAPRRASRRHERPRLGLSIAVPAGWKVVDRPLSVCTDPVQRLALRGHGAVIQIVESLHWGARGFPPRPHRFELRGEPGFLACCPPASGKGWFIPFRDRNRGFYAYVYLGGRETRSHALRILDSFRVDRTRTPQG